MISNGKPCSQHRKWGKIAYEYAGFYNSNKKCKDYLYELSMPNGRFAAAWSTEMLPLCGLSHFGKLYCKSGGTRIVQFQMLFMHKVDDKFDLEKHEI